jgi:hypothetical protein
MVRAAQEDLTRQKICDFRVGAYASETYPQFKALQKMLQLGQLIER